MTRAGVPPRSPGEMNIRMRPEPLGSSCEPWHASSPRCSPIFCIC